MKRRNFLFQSAAAALTAASLPGIAAASVRPDLIEAPDAWIGERFRLLDGGAMELVGVEHIGCERSCRQSRLQFRMLSGSAPADGTQALRHGNDTAFLFLQPGRVGPVASLNRLR